MLSVFVIVPEIWPHGFVSIAAEGGSAGETVILANDTLKDGLKTVTAQTDALLEVLSGASDAAVVDLTLAKALIG